MKALCLLMVVVFAFFSASLACATEYEITAKWDANTETDLAGYRLYCNNVRVAEIQAPTTEWTGRLELNDFTNTFELTAFDEGNLESKKSMPVIVHPAPYMPKGLTITITITF